MAHIFKKFFRFLIHYLRPFLLLFYQPTPLCVAIWNDF